MNDLEDRLQGSRPDPEGTAALIDRVIREAVDGDLADARYAVLETPIRSVLAVATVDGLAVLHYLGDGGVDEALRDVVDRLSPRLVEDPDGLGSVGEQLDAYFAGERRTFELEVDLRLVRGGFARRVLQVARRIPYGEVATYGEVAAAAGNPKASRAAGNALGSNPVPIVVPCHRVVRTGGGLGGYTGGLDVKRHLLALEGAA